MRLVQQWWLSTVNGGTHDLADHNLQKRVTIGVNRMSLSVCVLNLTIGTFCCLVLRSSMMLSGVIAETLLLILPLILNRYHRYNDAGLSICFIMSAATLFLHWVLGNVINAQLMVTYLIGVSLFMFSQLIYRVVSIASSILVLFLLEQDTKFKYIHPIIMDGSTQKMIRWSAYLAMILLVIGTFHLYWRYNRGLRQDLQKYAEKEAKENKNKDKFITNAGHEMKVSFHSIFAIIGVLINDIESDQGKDKILRDVRDLKAICKVAQNSNDNIIEFEKYTESIPRVKRDNIFNPRMLFETVIGIIKYLALDNKITIDFQISQTVPNHIQSDDVMIRHILTNLLVNAITHGSEDENSSVLVKCDWKNDMLVFSVQDYGKGIPKDVDIFAPFVSKNPDGLGIGLCIVKELVSKLNGKIQLNSNEKGTIFTISIPLQPIKRKMPAVSNHI